MAGRVPRPAQVEEHRQEQGREHRLLELVLPEYQKADLEGQQCRTSAEVAGVVAAVHDEPPVHDEELVPDELVPEVVPMLELPAGEERSGAVEEAVLQAGVLQAGEEAVPQEAAGDCCLPPREGIRRLRFALETRRCCCFLGQCYELKIVIK